MLKNNFLFLCLLLLSSTLFANEKVILQLKWFHQFQFAGYYAAKEKGFYKELGLDVEIRQRDLKYNNIQQVIDNDAQYGVADSVLFLYQERKEPIVIVSPIFQHSANILISRKDSNISTVYNLDNKNMIFYPNDTDGFSILALLKKFHLDPNLIRKREKDDYQKIINKQADIMPAYIINEPYLFKEKDVDINIINPMNYGIDIYGDILFTSKKEALKHPDRVKRFREATLKGWEYALENKEEIIQLIKEKYNTSKSIEHLKYEAKAIESLISKETIPLGYLDKGRVKYINDLYKEYGLIKNELNVNDFIFEDYINNNDLNLTKEEKNYLLNIKTIKIQNLKSFAPYNFEIANQAKGYTIEYMKLLAEVLNIKVEFISAESWTSALEMIKNAEMDILPNVVRNQEREEYMDFTEFSDVHFLTALGVKKNSTIKSMKDLKGKTLAILKNTFLEEIIREKYPEIKLLTTKTTKEALEAVSNSEADAIIDNLSTIEYFINNDWLSNIKTIKLNQDSKLPINTPLYFAVKKNNLLLKSVLEKANKTIKHNKLAKLKAEWLIKNYEDHIELNKLEYDYLADKKTINYCIDPNWMPLNKIEDNNHLGLSSEYIKIFEEKLGVTFNLVTTTSWSNTLEKIKNDSCELVPFIHKTSQRKKFLNFSKPFLSYPLVIATTLKEPYIANLKAIGKRKVAYVKDYSYKETLQAKYPNIEFVEVASINEGLKKVQKNKVFALIGLLPTVGFEIQKNFSNSLKISGEVEDLWELSTATKKEDFILNSIINKILLSISDEKKEKLFNKWNSVTYEEHLNLGKILIIAGIFIFIILLITYKNRQINKLNEDMKKYIKIVDEHVLTSSTDLEGNITQASKAFCKISGYSKEELIGKNHRIIRHKDTPKKLFIELWETLLKGKTWKGEIKNKKKDGSYYWVSANISPLFNKKNEIIGYTSIRHDITDKKRIEEISITDELTGLYNRRFFNEILEREINRAKRDQHPFALIIFDVDCFKQYNDNYGHPKGDAVLKEIGNSVKSLTKRSSDYGFRIGGEEFAIIFTPHFKENALEFAEMVNRSIEELKIEHKFNKASNYITVSIGVYAEVGEKIESSEAIYNHTDNALYKAKEKGRNQFVLYTK
ncbi:diguanylate cyclase [Halarcobacter bivalviorum]|uniref:diguanylate cyclase n=1 Tax=Halarcobacter bivalviorum TaxID=663364 RepID=UPI00100B8CEB|nr:transporter substrate-binding domain-containing protein [Halarcobacter bivalviorum]RXK07242.1 hypothetical protein CRU97_03800 [Halarcobacter bivalviorum]